MKRIGIIIELCLICSICKCQIISTNQDYSAKLNDTSFITFINPKIFRYLPYSFYIDLNDTSNILIEGRNISIGKDYRNFYRMRIADSNYFGGQISFYKLFNGTKTKIYETYIKAYELPITLSIRDKLSGSLISFSELQNNRLTASIINYGIQKEFPVKSFKLALVINDSFVEIKAEGNRINDEQSRYLKKLKDKAPIIFKDIIIEKENGTLLTMEALVYFLEKTSNKK